MFDFSCFFMINLSFEKVCEVIHFPNKIINKYIFSGSFY